MGSPHDPLHLTNPTYTGDLAQGRSRVKSYKVHEVESVPREEWVEVAGTHEAIIDYETFDKVQALFTAGYPYFSKRPGSPPVQRFSEMC